MYKPSFMIVFALIFAGPAMANKKETIIGQII